MEFSPIKQPREITLIKGIFYLVAIAFSLMMILLFTLKINKTAKGSNGEIFSNESILSYKAPIDSKVEKVFIQEGSQVKEGDTLISLSDHVLLAEIEHIKTSIQLSNKRIQILGNKIANQNQKQLLLENQLNFNADKKSIASKSSLEDIENINAQLQLLKEKLAILIEEDDKLFKLYNKGGISGAYYKEQYFKLIEEKDKILELERELKAKTNGESLAGAGLNVSKNQIGQEILNGKSALLELENQRVTEIESQQQLNIKLATLNSSNKELTIIAEQDGLITELFNKIGKNNFIVKGEVLLNLSTNKQREYFTHLKLNEEDIKYIKADQEVNLKLSAYNHYQYGVLKGNVVHVSKSNEENSPDQNYFLALVKISDDYNKEINLKNGYQTKGDIILENVRLSRIISEMLFQF